MPVTIKVRLATIDDAVALAGLNQAFNGVVEPPEKLAARFGDARRVDYPVLAEIGDRVVGFACLRLVPCVFYPEPYAELSEAYVEPDYRRMGVGKALVAYAETLASRNGAVEVVLLTNLHNQEGQDFYRAIGYAQTQMAMGKSIK